ncbi:hypothetical protein AQUCO_00901079v1 [Aquilegia coerulea]|uniref:Uncharacterized protein n=1 Tax=Aquilegia coerulea TaxID=218851 RepID=A0A2G5EGM8_AQUCA|nr:hypothetical protein AQUCO_00901079v1 [Aquilegia coerulea]
MHTSLLMSLLLSLPWTPFLFAFWRLIFLQGNLYPLAFSVTRCLSSLDELGVDCMSSCLCICLSDSWTSWLPWNNQDSTYYCTCTTSFKALLFKYFLFFTYTSCSISVDLCL